MSHWLVAENPIDIWEIMQLFMLIMSFPTMLSGLDLFPLSVIPPDFSTFSRFSDVHLFPFFWTLMYEDTYLPPLLI